MKFKPNVSTARNAVVIIFDLESFSAFLNQPDVQEYAAAFINRVFSSVFATIEGGSNAAMDSIPKLPSVSIAQAKFMGDGALYILLPAPGFDQILESDIIALSNRLWNLKSGFRQVLKACADDVPVFDLPPRIRFGLARGAVYELEQDNGNKEYIGFALNLASRLQRYCPDLGFIASARLKLPAKTLGENGYKRVVAKKIRGFPKEIVIVDSKEFGRLKKEVSEDLFEEIT